MKNIYKALGPLVITVGAMVPVHGQAQTITLKFSHFLSSNSNFQKQIAEPWCAAIENDSGGRLKCQIYPALQLGGTPAQLADQVKNGVADVAWTSPSYSTGRFPRTEALELPFTLPSDGLRGSRAMWEFTTRYAMEDYKDFHLLAMFSATNPIISTSKKPVIVASDLNGLRLRSPSRFISLFLSALGATPVNMPVAQVTEGIAKGVLDGVLAPWEVLPSTKIDEVTTYHMESFNELPGFSLTPLAIMMNKAKYESLPADLKAVIDKHSGMSLVELAAKSFDDGNAQARKKLIAQGNKVLLIKESEYNEMRKKTASLRADWVKQANARGLNGEQLATEITNIGQKYLSK